LIFVNGVIIDVSFTSVCYCSWMLCQYEQIA